MGRRKFKRCRSISQRYGVRCDLKSGHSKLKDPTRRVHWWRSGGNAHQFACWHPSGTDAAGGSPPPTSVTGKPISPPEHKASK